MSYNGSGTFVRLMNWSADAANGILIRSDRMDTDSNDFVSGLTNAICKDGQSTTSAVIKFAVGTQTYDGTVGTPGYGFTSETSSGMWRVSAGNIGVSVTGVNAVTFNGTGYTAGTHYTLGAGGTPIYAAGTINNYYQISLQNKSSGTTASTDMVCTADTGTDTTNYIDMGINSSGFTGSAPFSAALDGYLYAKSGNIGIGTKAAKSIYLATNNITAVTIDSSQNVNTGSGNLSVNTNKFTVTGSNGNTSVAGVLTATGGITVGGTNATAPLIDKVAIQKFTASGTYTPTSGMVYCIIECWGGGGAGGGATTSGANAVGAGGGGAGGYSKLIATASTIGASQTATVGAGGAGSLGATGGNGGDTSIGTICIAKGGSGGIVLSGAGSTSGGAGGSTTGAVGDLVIPGQHGYGSPGGGNSAYNDAWGGCGGTSIMGNAGTPTVGGNQDGVAASGYAAGGGGASLSNTTANKTGGNGAGGLIVITEYITA